MRTPAIASPHSPSLLASAWFVAALVVITLPLTLYDPWFALPFLALGAAWTGYVSLACVRAGQRWRALAASAACILVVLATLALVAIGITQ